MTCWTKRFIFQSRKQRKRQKIVDLIKEIKIKECVFKIDNSWECLTKYSLKNAWTKLHGKDYFYDPQKIDSLDIEMRAVTSRIPDLKDYPEETILPWA